MKNRNYGEISLSDSIQAFLKEKKLDTEMYHQVIVSQWKAIVGEVAAYHTTNLFFKEKTLYVKMNNSCWRNELHYRKTEIIQKVNEYVNVELISEIQVY